MTFELLPLRFEFTAADPVYFPPGKAANILRGALGILFRNEVCNRGCPGAKTCLGRRQCAYAVAFEPSAALAEAGQPAPSGLAEWPRPFVFRSRHLDGCRIAPGESFSFGLNLFTFRPDVLAGFIAAFTRLAQEGLGPGRGRVRLDRVVRPDASGGHVSVLFPGEGASAEPLVLDLAPRQSAPAEIRVEFVTPVELKREGRIVARPDFGVLLGRIRDRLSALRGLYGAAPLDVDYRLFEMRASRIAMTRCEMRREHALRLSARTGQSHPIGGLTGWASYRGEFAEFLPWLEAARWTGVGRQAVWGKGEIRVAASE